MIINAADIDAMEKLHRVQLATSLPGAKPICLVGTKSLAGVTNLAPFSSITHFGSSPMLIGMVTRPDTVDRNTLRNILDTESWTLNHVHREILEKAHQCSARYPAETSEFSAVGINEHFHPNITAPFVKESRVRYALGLEDIVDIKANNTKLIIGRVQLIEIPEAALHGDGGINLIESGSLASTALDTYFSISKVAQMKYAKP
ncbi:MAG: flavin reductase (DIM6/NTAB) family NADH-FMN oxidoreductase RutF [Cryomorphaceae bacterium]|jgi:flavin reductase (DIM6/NTAB) family NADH-FMN oxidoreductase RutF